jgi:hypothetical protein
MPFPVAVNVPLTPPVLCQETSHATGNPCIDFLMRFLVEKPPHTGHFQPTRKTAVILTLAFSLR